MRLDLLPRIAELPVSHPFRKRGLHAESLVRTALEVSRVRPRFARKPCGARVRSNGKTSGGDCAHGGKKFCRPLGKRHGLPAGRRLQIPQSARETNWTTWTREPANPDFTNAPGHGDDDARFYDRQQAYVHARGG